MGAVAPEWIPAYAGMTVIIGGAVAVRQGDSSTLSRRVRGVLSPYRERGIRRLRAGQWGEIPAYAGMTVMGRLRGERVGSASSSLARDSPPNPRLRSPRRRRAFRERELPNAIRSDNGRPSPSPDSAASPPPPSKREFLSGLSAHA